jgi:hypothetical protein
VANKTDTLSGLPSYIKGAGILELTTVQWDEVIEGATTGGLSPGTLYYLSATNNGQITSTPPGGSLPPLSVGQAVTNTEFLIRLNDLEQLAVTLSGAVVAFGGTPPAGAVNGTLWIDTGTGYLRYYNSGAWPEICQLLNTVVSPTQPTTTEEGTTWYNQTNKDYSLYYNGNWEVLSSSVIDPGVY